MFAYIPNPYAQGELPRSGGHGWLGVPTEPAKEHIFTTHVPESKTGRHAA